jgi:tetratricopeptide (TPR) repeat protein
VILKDDKALIEKFIDNDLTAEELLIFNSRKKDNDFLNELKFQQTIVESIQLVNLKEERSRLKSMLMMPAPKSTPVILFKHWLGIAASIILLLAAIFFVSRNTTTPQSLYVTYYKPYPINLTRDETQLMPAFTEYYSQNYLEASVLLEELLSQKDNNSSLARIHILLGNCYLNTDRLDKALVNFKAAMNSDDAILKQHGQWYYALVLLRQNRINETSKLLSEVIQSRSLYATQAQALADALKNIQ